MRRAAHIVAAVAALLALELAALPAMAADQNRVGVSPATIRAEVRDILSAPEYNRKFEPESPSRLAAWLSEKFNDFVEWLAHGFGGGGGRALASVLAVLVVIAFLALCVLLVFRLTSRFKGRLAANEEDDGETYDLPSSSRLMSEAARLAERGDYRGAFLKAYLATISYLDEIQALRFERSRTNWEYLRELRNQGRDSVAAELRPLTADFDRKLYGHDQCDQQDYDRAVLTYEQVRQMA